MNKWYRINELNSNTEPHKLLKNKQINLLPPSKSNIYLETLKYIVKTINTLNQNKSGKNIRGYVAQNRKLLKRKGKKSNY